MTPSFDAPQPSAAVRAALTPHGVLRAGINLSNGLLVSGRTADGDPDGVSPDMARAVAAALGVPCVLVPFETPGVLADAVARDAWDIGLIGAEPQRAETMAFTPAYAEIEACYAVRDGSDLAVNADVDRPGIRIVTMARAAFTLWLERNIRSASIVPAEGIDACFEIFMSGGADVIASLKSKLIADLPADMRVLQPGFMIVQQAVGCARSQDPAVSAWLSDVVRAACAGGFVTERIQSHGVIGLSAAQPA